MKKNEGLSFLGTNGKDEGLRSKKRRGFAIANTANLFSLAGRYKNPIPSRFLAPIHCFKNTDSEL